jgi:CheY-like chemotaxis protein
LLVDDDPSVIRGLWRILRSCRPDFQVNTAASAGQALQALSDLSYDAVITDLQMPGGGLAVVSALLEHYPSTARIIHSSQLESSDTQQLRKLVHVVLAKPATESDTVVAIERAMQLAASERAAARPG